jgi:hypothetical protein
MPILEIRKLEKILKLNGLNTDQIASTSNQLDKKTNYTNFLAEDHEENLAQNKESMQENFDEV